MLIEGDAFCTHCGTQRSEQAAPTAPARFCTRCGAALAPATKVCTQCGAPAATPPAVAPAPAGGSGLAEGASITRADDPVRGIARQDPASGGRTPESTTQIPKAAIVGVVIAVLILAVVTSLIQSARRARQRAAEIAAMQRNLDNLAAMANSAATSANKEAPVGIEQNVAGSTPANTPQAMTLEELNESLADAAAVASAIVQNAGKPISAIPQNALPRNSSSISAPNSGGYEWTSRGVTYTWNSAGLRYETARRSGTYPGCAVAHLAPVEPPSIVPAAATGDAARDWALKYERTVGGSEADLVVRTGDINNLGFGWPKGFDPFSGQSTPNHPYPWKPPSDEPPGTDRIMVGSVVAGADQLSHPGDGYSTLISSCTCPANFPPCPGRLDTMPQEILLPVGALPSKTNAVLLQIFADDFQARTFHSHFQVSLNGTRIPTIEYAINSLDQTGPIGKLLTLRLLPEYWPLLKSGTVNLLIDDPTTHVPDGYAVDFVRILVNPHNFKYQVSLTATVTDADKHTPVPGAVVTAELESAATDRVGKCQFTGLPAGLVVATANAPGYDENSMPVDLPAGQSGHAELQLRRHQETTAALEKSIEQTGTATIYGIHFDTDSSKIRGDSLPALNAVLGLIKNRPGLRWAISGHTDNQGTAALNQPLSEQRASAVIAWLEAAGADTRELAAQGFGATRPVADNSTEAGRALNRRVEVALAK